MRLLVEEKGLHAGHVSWWWLDGIWPREPSARGNEIATEVSTWAGFAKIQAVFCRLNTKARQNSFCISRKLAIYGGDNETDGGMACWPLAKGQNKKDDAKLFTGENSGRQSWNAGEGHQKWWLAMAVRMEEGGCAIETKGEFVGKEKENKRKR